MRTAILCTILLTSVPATASADDPKTSASGGTASAASTNSASKPSGETYPIDERTGSGTVSRVDLPPQASGMVFAGLVMGTATPAFRPLVTADIPTGTSGSMIPLLSGRNTWSAQQRTLISPSGVIPNGTLGYVPVAAVIDIPSDDASQTSFIPGQKLPSGLFVSDFFGGPDVNNGRDGLTVECGLAAPTSHSNAYRFYVCGNFYGHTSSSDNGTSEAPSGVLEGNTSQAALNAGAMNWYSVIGYESSVAIETGASATIKALILTDNWPTDKVHGSAIDTHIASYGVRGGVSLNTWADISNWGGGAPVSVNGTLIKVYGGWTLATGIDLSGVTVAGNVLQWGPSSIYFISGTGAAKFENVTSSVSRITSIYSAENLLAGIDGAPACSAVNQGLEVLVTSYSSTPAWHATVLAGDSTEVIKAFCTGSRWIYE